MTLFKSLRGDISAVFENDPAASNILEVLMYQGLHAITVHRFNHWLYKHRVPLLPRLISQFIRFVTGIEIHPGARIGKRFFIDHGMGIVIGETTEVGDNVVMYQGATLGGTGKHQGKRHPTLGSRVVVGAGAAVLGPINIGHNVRIGAGAVVVKDVPDETTVVGVPGRVIRHRGVRVGNTLEHGDIDDPLTERLRKIEERLSNLEERK